MKLKINNLDLAYTIDTYGMFTGDSIEDSELDWYKLEYNLTDKQLEAVEFDYNHVDIVDNLACASVNILSNEFANDPIIQDISLPVSSNSPKYYNYTTDSYISEWTIDFSKLKEYCNDSPEFKQFIADSWDYEYSNAIESNDDATIAVAMLDYYTRQVLSEDSYNMQMFEYEAEAYVNNMTVDKHTQKLIDARDN